MDRRRSRALALVSGVLLTLATFASANANAPDPTLDLGWKWPANTVGTYRFDATFPNIAWMRNAGTASVNHISHSPYRNPDFNLVGSGPANVTLRMLNSAKTQCAGLGFFWVGCASTTLNAPFTTWWVTLASNNCWTNGAGGRTCGGDDGAFDVQTVILNEMGHVNFLNHHFNPDYFDAVVQGVPVRFPNANWSMRTLRQMDNAKLKTLYGVDACPCPLGADQ